MGGFAPDYVEPIVAWRVWRTQQRDGRTWLRSAYRPVRWPANEPLSALCARRGLRPGRRGHHVAPAPDCVCGIYGVPRFVEEETQQLDRQFDCLVLGQVSLWGVVCEHYEGWRASLAYPARLYVWKRRGYRHDVRCLARGLQRYDVPVATVESASVGDIFPEIVGPHRGHESLRDQPRWPRADRDEIR